MGRATDHRGLRIREARRPRRNDIAVLWPPHGAPIVMAVLSSRAGKDAASADALIADATKLALQQLS
jgi:beta-lactamase class A